MSEQMRLPFKHGGEQHKQVQLSDGSTASVNYEKQFLWTNHQQRYKGFEGTKVYQSQNLLIMAYEVYRGKQSVPRLATSEEIRRWKEVFSSTATL